MEFGEKLQELRKGRGLTQEELAESLFVSRTAISKWESGRGYPSIDSLREISRFFSVTIDELLSSDEVITIAKEESRQKEGHLRDLVFGLIDCSVLLLFVLPFFGQTEEGVVRGVSLLSLSEISSWLRAIYFSVVFAAVLWGVLTLAMQSCRVSVWLQLKNKISIFLNGAGVLLFIIGTQPYAAVFLFAFLIIKALMLIKWQ